ncbi:MAG TPA: hypothetical protein PK430_08905 [Muribaculum sp.]|nr:hypothetical protein [Muribaculum sp.]
MGCCIPETAPSEGRLVPGYRWAGAFAGSRYLGDFQGQPQNPMEGQMGCHNQSNGCRRVGAPVVRRP